MESENTMSVIAVGHMEWQVLRAVRRGERGRALRPTQSHRTKDGTFLLRMVEENLLRVVVTHEDPFMIVYALTPAGEYVAEHGEGELEFSPRRYRDPV